MNNETKKEWAEATGIGPEEPDFGKDGAHEKHCREVMAMATVLSMSLPRPQRPTMTLTIHTKNGSKTYPVTRDDMVRFLMSMLIEDITSPSDGQLEIGDDFYMQGEITHWEHVDDRGQVITPDMNPLDMAASIAGETIKR